jgi:pyruvate dehydrogenase (quinone)
MLMNGINGLVSIAERWKQWSDPRLIVMVLNNRDLNEVTWEQRVTEGDPKFSPSQDVPDFQYARFAQLLGLGGVRLERPENVGPGWEQALAADRPFLLDITTDPNVPPLPPNVTMQQMRNYAAALLRGDTDGLSMLRATAKEWWAGKFPAKDAVNKEEVELP